MEDLYRFKNRSEYLKALDMVILKKDIQSRDIGNGKVHNYFPISIKEAIADYVFFEWNVIDDRYTVINEMLTATVKLTYVPNYPEAEEKFCTGTSAVLIQKKQNALEYQLPAVLSEAVGNALGRLGNIFGRNLSRKLNKDVLMSIDFSLRRDKNTTPKEPIPPKIEPTAEKIEVKKQEIEVKKQEIDLPF